jgi:hypothetical protein
MQKSVAGQLRLWRARSVLLHDCIALPHKGYETLGMLLIRWILLGKEFEHDPLLLVDAQCEYDGLGYFLTSMLVWVKEYADGHPTKRVDVEGR